LLISGVDPVATREDIRPVTGAYNRIFDCCVDLGRKPETPSATRGKRRSGRRRTGSTS
jgi:hypothetical protein